MYKLSVPIMSSTVNENNRERYVELCRKAGAQRVFLCNGSILAPIPDGLRENVKYFKSQGFEVGIWTDTVGHGAVLEHVETGGDLPVFSPIVNIKGEERPFANCPMGENFKSYISKYIAELSKTGTDIVMLDDDFRMSQHGSELCCACPDHLRRMSEILGEEITAEKIRPYVLTGKANKYRDAWLQAQNDGMVEMARAIRREVDKESPEVTVCMCTASAPWNVDGIDVAQITRILAGNNKPILRLTGAPYWAYNRTRRFPLVTVFEIARMLASFVKDEGFDLMSEGDVYPRPRYTCPASYLELYDVATRIDGGYTGILKYMFDYVAGTELEMGYLTHHDDNREFLERTKELFKNGANAGVRIITAPHTMKHADLDLSHLDEISPRPLDGTMLGNSGIPTIYRGRGICNSVFGENARMLDLSLLGEGTMLDAVSAIILTERGVDVGLASYDGLTDKKISFICTDDTEYKSFINDGQVRYLAAALKDGAEPLIFATEPKGSYNLAYRYENAKGERFLVFLFEGDSIYGPTRACMSGLVKNYVTQRVLVNTLPWVAGEPIPAYCEGNPELYLMCEKGEGYMSVALLNCFADHAKPTVILDEEYSRIECVECDATLDGNRVEFGSRLYGYTSAMFKVYK